MPDRLCWFMPKGTLKAITLYDLTLNSAWDPSFSHSFFWFNKFESQLAAPSESPPLPVPPFLELTTARILPVGIPSSDKILLSSTFSWIVSKCENLESLIPWIRNCLALMPSLAAILGFAWAGGLTKTDAYVVAEGLPTVGVVDAILVRWASVTLACSSILSFASSINILKSEVNSDI